MSETVDDLASRVTVGRHVICHADAHPGNLLAAGDGPLHVVDWDAPIYYRSERSLDDVTQFLNPQASAEAPTTCTG